MVYLPPLLSTSQSPRLHTCLPPHLLYVKPSVSRSNCTGVTNAVGFFLYLRLAPTGTPCLLRFIVGCPEPFPCLWFIRYGIADSRVTNRILNTSHARRIAPSRFGVEHPRPYAVGCHRLSERPSRLRGSFISSATYTNPYTRRGCLPSNIPKATGAETK